jgi:crotonobetainyl-CoA:carnitine CoA-transferase CaiB-like acyl-CoA transferase
MTAGVLAALFRQRITGKGCKLSISLFASALWTIGANLLQSQHPFYEQYPKNRLTNPTIPTINLYQCADGEWIYLSIYQFWILWDKFAEAIEKPEWIGDKNLSMNIAYIRENMASITEGVQEAMGKKTSAEWEKIFTRYDIPHQRCKHIREQIDDPQAWENGYLYKQVFKDGQTMVMSNIPIQFSDLAPRAYESTGRLGEDTREILQSYYTENEIESMLADKIAVSAK